MWALIIDGAVFEITDINPSERFHPSLEWVECDTSVKQNMRYENGEFMEVPADE